MSDSRSCTEIVDGVAQAVHGDDDVVDLQSARQWISSVWEQMRRSAPRIVVSRAAHRAFYLPVDQTITVPSRGTTSSCMAHAIAHAIVHGRNEPVGPLHGPRFWDALLSVLEASMSRTAARAVADSLIS